VLADTAAFAVAVLLLAMVPGPSFAVVTRQTLRAGRRHAFFTILGNATGVAFWATAAVLGLSLLVATSRLAYAGVRVAGAVVLVVLGVRSLLASRRLRRGRAHGGTAEEKPAELEPPPAGWLAGYRTGLLIALANPKAAVFATSVLPQFVSSDTPATGQFLLLVAVWVTVSSGWYVVVSWLVSRAAGLLRRMAVRRRLEQVSGGVLIAVGLRMVVDTR
jgi:threonine/homoserine/homoserine lactone efflux protein